MRYLAFQPISSLSFGCNIYEVGHAQNGQKLEKAAPLGLFGWDSGAGPLLFCGEDGDNTAVYHYHPHPHPPHHAHHAH